TVEPMVNAGRRHLTMLNDGWTVVTKDKSLSAQWELEVLVTETGYDILTVSEGTPEPPEWVKGWKKPAFA
ncbi:MAG: type I methionyl aminopeptidase, partial [Duodenibacillus sp.]